MSQEHQRVTRAQTGDLQRIVGTAGCRTLIRLSVLVLVILATVVNGFAETKNGKDLARLRKLLQGDGDERHDAAFQASWLGPLARGMEGRLWEIAETEDEVELRVQCYIALGAIGPRGPADRHRAVAAVRRELRGDRYALAEAIGVVVDFRAATAGAREVLLTVVGGGDDRDAAIAAGALLELGFDEEAARKLLLDLLRSGREYAPGHALGQIGELGPAGESFLPAVLEWAGKADDASRLQAVNALRMIAPERKETVEFIGACRKSADAELRNYAWACYAMLTGEAEEALGILKKLLDESREPGSRAGVLVLLSFVAVRSPAAAAILVDEVESNHHELAFFAARLLASIGNRGRVVIDALAGALSYDRGIICTHGRNPARDARLALGLIRDHDLDGETIRAALQVLAKEGALSERILARHLLAQRD